MNIKDSLFAVVDEQGERYGGCTNTFKLMTSRTGAERVCRQEQRYQNSYADYHGFPPNTLKVIELSLTEVVK